MSGYYGRILKINLTSTQFQTQTIEKDVYAKYMGGKGLASYLLYELNPPGIDPLHPDNCLIFATSDRGACHLRATFYKPELTGMIPPEQIEGKAALFIEFEDRLTIFDALIFCRFYRDLYLWDVLGETVHAATGLASDKESLKSIASAISNIIRRFNIREGLTPDDDWLPKKLFQKLENTGREIKPEELAHMRKEYYQLRGWDEQGVPR